VNLKSACKARLISGSEANEIVKADKMVFSKFCIDVFMSEHTPPKICRNTNRNNWALKEWTYYNRSGSRYMLSSYFSEKNA
jgi:hypothetical protein